MPKYLLLVFLTLASVGLGQQWLGAQDAIDFGDPLPLPPPPLEDTQLTPPPTPTSPPAAAPAPALPAPSAANAATVTPPTPPPVPPPAPPAPPAPRAPEPSPIGAAPPKSEFESLDVAPPPVLPPSLPGGDDVAPVALPASVQAPSGGVADTVFASAEETPRPGRVTGGRVNVRAGPNTQYESIAVLTTGAPITVLAKHGEWYKVVFPADQLASIHKSAVDAEITGEIPESGLPGTVNQDNADVHAFYWDKSTVVGKLKKGTPVVIKQERGQWYRIVPPESARAYVFADYVKLDGGGPVVADRSAAPENSAVDPNAGKPDASGRLAMSENDRKAAALKDAYFRKLKERETQKIEAEEEAQNELVDAIDSVEARIKAIDEETRARMGYTTLVNPPVGTATWSQPDPAYGGYTGVLENIGRVGGAPANFRLVKGGEIRFFLRSNTVNLEQHIGNRVWVNGNVELSAGSSANVLNVEQLRVLTDAEAIPGTVIVQTPSSPAAMTEYVTPSGATMIDVTTSAPAAPVSPSSLPEHVGVGSPGTSVYEFQAAPGATTGITVTSPGEVETDYFENPVISEVGP